MQLTRTRSLARDRRGVVAIEFAVTAPFLCLAIFMGLEVAWLALGNVKAAQISSQTADAAARVENTIDETDIAQIMTAARLTGKSRDFADHGRVILSSIQLNPAGNGQWVRWQRCFGTLTSFKSAYGAQGAGQADSSIQGVGPKKMAAAAGDAIIVAEVAYQYQPLVSSSFMGPETLKSQSAFMVRDRTDLSLTNTTNLKGSQVYSC